MAITVFIGGVIYGVLGFLKNRARWSDGFNPRKFGLTVTLAGVIALVNYYSGVSNYFEGIEEAIMAGVSETVLLQQLVKLVSALSRQAS